jgi:TLC domain
MSGKLQDGGTKSDASECRRLHDVFNLVALPIVSASNVSFLIMREEKFMWAQFYAFAVYILADTVWVMLRPQCVASPSTIIIHHVVCLIGWVVPHLIDTSLAFWMSLGVVVEINTILLIARRHFGRTFFGEILFYSTWIGLRLILFPTSLYLFSFECARYTASEAKGNWLNIGVFILFTMIFLNVLNLKWSWDLFIKPRKQKGPSEGL